MVRRKHRRSRRQLTGLHIVQLANGFDHLGCAFGDDLPAMRAAWQDVQIRADVLARQQATGRAVSFAEFCFGVDGADGVDLTSQDMARVRHQYITRNLRRREDANSKEAD